MTTDDNVRRAGAGDRAPRRPVGWLVAPCVVAELAIILAAPWLDERLFWCEWVGVAAVLLLVPRIRGWRGESLTLAGAAAALAIAFHWTPPMISEAMNVDVATGCVVAAAIILWDAVRVALPFWVAARVTSDPLAAWFPAGLAAVVAEAAVPAVFPWKLGYAQVGCPLVVQSVDLGGAACATFVVFAHAGALAWAATAMMPRLRQPARAAPGLAVAAVAVCLVNAGYGAAGLLWWNRSIAAAPGLRVALVQANPADDGGLETLRHLTQLTCSGTGRLPDLVCWPECCGGSYEAGLESLADPELVVAKSRPPHRGMRPLEDPSCPLLFGGTTFFGHPEKPRVVHPSAVLVDASQTILGRYHKRHLMPFGEYVPGGSLYPPLETYFPMQQGMTEGTEATVLECGPHARLGVLLCYEDMIPEAARSLVARSATVLVSLVNGSSFKAPLTLRQHRMLAQLRAVECRRALVRCAATGETCVVSPLGSITARLPLQVSDVLVAEVPLLGQRTLASRIAPAIPFAAGLVLVSIGFRRRGAAADHPVTRPLPAPR